MTTIGTALFRSGDEAPLGPVSRIEWRAGVIRFVWSLKPVAAPE